MLKKISIGISNGQNNRLEWINSFKKNWNPTFKVDKKQPHNFEWFFIELAWKFVPFESASMEKEEFQIYPTQFGFTALTIWRFSEIAMPPKTLNAIQNKKSLSIGTVTINVQKIIKNQNFYIQFTFNFYIQFTFKFQICLWFFSLTPAVESSPSAKPCAFCIDYENSLDKDYILHQCWRFRFDFYQILPRVSLAKNIFRHGSELR